MSEPADDELQAQAEAAHENVLRMVEDMRVRNTRLEEPLRVLRNLLRLYGFPVD